MKLIKADELIDLIKSSGGKFKVNSIDKAYQFCENLAKSHYENFPVGSILIPKKIRKYVYSIYSFARIADDLADEIKLDNQTKLNALNNYLLLLKDFSILKNISGNPVIIATQDTILKKDIPIETLEKLITAFKLDSDFQQPNNYNDLLNYCSYSANPIGELILRLFDEWTTENQFYSDKICTALQLINFWQDFSIDLKNGRCYIPREIMEQYHLSYIDNSISYNPNELNLCFNELFDFTEKLMIEGTKLLKLIKNFRLRQEIKITINTAMTVFEKSKKLNIKLLEVRPKLDKFDYIKVLLLNKF